MFEVALSFFHFLFFLQLPKKSLLVKLIFGVGCERKREGYIYVGELTWQALLAHKSHTGLKGFKGVTWKIDEWDLDWPLDHF